MILICVIEWHTVQGARVHFLLICNIMQFIFLVFLHTGNFKQGAPTVYPWVPIKPTIVRVLGRLILNVCQMSLALCKENQISVYYTHIML